MSVVSVRRACPEAGRGQGGYLVVAQGLDEVHDVLAALEPELQHFALSVERNTRDGGLVVKAMLFRTKGL